MKLKKFLSLVLAIGSLAVASNCITLAAMRRDELIGSPFILDFNDDMDIEEDAGVEEETFDYPQRNVFDEDNERTQEIILTMQERQLYSQILGRPVASLRRVSVVREAMSRLEDIIRNSNNYQNFIADFFRVNVSQLNRRHVNNFLQVCHDLNASLANRIRFRILEEGAPVTGPLNLDED